MNTLLNNDRDQDIEDMHGHSSYGKDREITLGTTMVLGIFFALAVFGAVFFGFGYSVGAKHTMATSTVASEPTASAIFRSFKPAPGSPAGQVTSTKTPAGETVAVPYQAANLTPGSAKPAPAVKAPVDAFTQEDPPAPVAIKPNGKAALPVVASSTAVPPIAASGQFTVQVAAVSHQEDADLLTTTLKRRGYSVAVRTEPQDKFLHVQIGPFGTHKDADAMKQKLLSDGFNAIVK